MYTNHIQRKCHELDIITRNKYLRATQCRIREMRKNGILCFGIVRIFNGFFDDDATSRRSEN
jgi:hypothetical protein